MKTPRFFVLLISIATLFGCSGLESLGTVPPDVLMAKDGETGEHVLVDVLSQLQSLPDGFKWYYNNERRHRSLDDEVPSTVYEQSKRKAA